MKQLENQASIYLTGMVSVHFSVSICPLLYRVSTCIANCSGRGYCHESTGVCTCDVNWTGEYCQDPVCPNNCYHKGVCINNQCHCNTGYTGMIDKYISN